MKYTYLDLIEEVLCKEKTDMSLKEIWNKAIESKLDEKLSSIGRTPINTMNSCIRKNIKTSHKVRFKQTSKNPALYYLND